MTCSQEIFSTDFSLEDVCSPFFSAFFANEHILNKDFDIFLTAFNDLP